MKSQLAVVAAALALVGLSAPAQAELLELHIGGDVDTSVAMPMEIERTLVAPAVIGAPVVINHTGIIDPLTHPVALGRPLTETIIMNSAVLAPTTLIESPAVLERTIDHSAVLESQFLIPTGEPKVFLNPLVRDVEYVDVDLDLD